MNTVKIKIPSFVRYLSELEEFKERLPLGIFNKKSTDVGATYCVLNSNSNYIIVCPTIDLVINKSKSKSNKYKVFGLHGNSKNSEFRNYISDNNIHKILVTYDSLPKLIKWFNSLKINPYDYNIVFDEFHLLLSELGYREKAIYSLLKESKNFKHYTFMSATPIIEDFLPSDFKEIPYTELEWECLDKLIPRRCKTNNPFKTTVNIIREFKQGMYLTVNGVKVRVKELFIFLNSVVGINQIIKTSGLTNDDVKVVCSNSIKNQKQLEDIEISEMTGENKSVNFFTSKGFQGCDLYSDNGLIIVVSDSKRKHTLIDIQTTLHQIAGRIRSESNNIFKNRIWHIYSFNNNIQSKEEYENWKNENIQCSKELLEDFNGMSEIKRLRYAQKLDIEGDFCIFDEEEKMFKYSELKEKFADYNYKLTHLIYKDGAYIRSEYGKANVQLESQEFLNDDNIILEKVKTVSFKELLQQYIQLKALNLEKELINRFEIEYPLFKEAYEKLGIKTINSCKFTEEKIKEKLYSVSANDIIKKEILNILKQNEFYSLKELKEKLQIVYNKLKIKQAAKVTLLEGLINMEKKNKRINGKIIKGFIIK